MLNGWWRGTRLGCGTGLYRLRDELSTGKISAQEMRDAESAMIRSRGHCNTMGTASTMACVAETLGMTLPGNSAMPAADSRLLALAHAAGRRAVEIVRDDLRPSRILTPESFRNAFRLVAAIGGSTNSVVHLLALARRLGIEFGLGDIDAAGRDVPLLVNLQPAGEYLMEDFFAAGGLDAVLGRLRALLEPALTVNGGSLDEQITGSPPADPEVIRELARPFADAAGLAVLRGNLCPNGALVKPTAASPQLLQHRGRALVFDGLEDLTARLNDPDLDVEESTVLVLRGCGPQGYPGMPEVGNLPIPAKLLRAGVTDMVRISDERMSGTAFGTVVLHVSPESAVGGPLGLVRTGDWIDLDVKARTLHIDVPDGELARRSPVTAAAPMPSSGWEFLYRSTVEQADTGAGLDFLAGARGSAVGRPPH